MIRTGRFFAVMVFGWVMLSAISFGYSGGDGSAGNPYKIADANDLLVLGADTGNYDKSFILTADIDLAGQTFTTAIIAPDTNSSSSGFQGTAFAGTFDGNGFKIKTLTITGGNNDYLGLLGYINSDGKIKNLGIENAAITGTSDCRFAGGLLGYNNHGGVSKCYSTGDISGYESIGGLVGCNNYGSISNCYSTVSVIGSSVSRPVGGLVGNNNYGSISRCYATGNVRGYYDVGGLLGNGSHGTISQCYATGSVNGYSNIGGLTGYNSSSSITQCYSTGSVTGTNTPVGGLLGINNSGMVINCFNTGMVTGPVYVGGLVGQNYGTIITCYSTGYIASTSIFAGGLVGDNHISAGTVFSCFWDTQTSGKTTSNGGTGKTTAQMKDFGTYLAAGWSFIYGTEKTGDWIMLDNSYPTPAWEVYSQGVIPGLKGLTEQEAGTSLTAAGFLPGETYFVYDISVPAGRVSDTYPKTGSSVYLRLTPVHILLAKETKYSGGDGMTEPYRIATVGDLLDTMASPLDWNRSFILTADIDLEGQDFTTAIIAPDTNLGTAGFQGTVFTGLFNGNGHIIRHLKINASGDCYGLLGWIDSGGQVMNLGMEDVSMLGHNFVGGLAGCSNYGSINNCYVTGYVNSSSGSYCTGGLVGCNNRGDISTCYSSGTVNGPVHVGGLVGSHDKGNISNCYSTSTVSGNSRVGGLAGTNENGSISNCYSTGPVTGTNSVGGLVGLQYPGSVSKCFWDTTNSGIMDGVGSVNPDPAGVTGKTTAQMKTLSTFTAAGWDFTNETANGTNNYWRMCVDGEGYPWLNWEFSNHGDFVCPDGVSVEDLDYFVGRWLLENCTSANNYCGGGDVDSSGEVDLADFSVFTQHWLEI